MGRTVNAKIAALPRARRAKVKARAAQLVAEEMSLQALRKALGHTQAKVAAELGVGQDTVSRYEQRADMLLSTLQQYIKAMGGTLCLVAEFPDRPPIRLSTLAEIGG
jgi:DNA-binding transcriptional regulator YiaG